MKFFPYKKRIRQFVRKKKLNRRRLISLEKAKYARIYGQSRQINDPTRGHAKVIRLPPRLSLETHYVEVMQCVEEIRELGLRQKQQIFIDFSGVQEVGPCGALLIASELDRWRRLHQFRHRVFPKTWNQNVLRLMGEMGLFEMLGVINPPKRSNTNINKDVTFFRFRTGAYTTGSDVAKFADEIQNCAGSLPKRKTMYRGITEAMANVANHAYPSDHDYNLPIFPGRWWMGGSYDSATRKLTVIVYDQGVGIPHTLPRNYPMEILRGLLDRFGLIDDDASRIKISMDLGRTQTGEKYRGKGLFRDIRPYTESINHGRLRILSNRGEYVYSPHDSIDTNKEKLFTHSQSIGGTLILWEGNLN